MANHENAPYNYTLWVRDSISNTSVSGVTVTFNNETRTTGSDGRTSFLINPIQGAYFTAIKEGCTYWLYADGSPTTYLLRTYKSGYVNSTRSISPATENTVTIGNTSTWTLETNRTIWLDQSGVIVTLHVLTEDGIEIFPDSYTGYVSGNLNQTWTYKNGLRISRAYNNEWPTKFIMYHNTTTFTLSATLEYPGGANMTTTQAVVTDNQYDIDFVIPYSLLELPCATSSECAPSFCDGNGFYQQLKGCQNSQCRYNTLDCISPSLCDPDVGCFDYATNDTCTRNLDCNNTCVDDYSMLLGRCASTGYCVNLYRECTGECNATIGICQDFANCVIENDKVVGWQIPGKTGFNTIGSLNCDLNTAGLSYCYHGDLITAAYLSSIGATASGIATYPGGWPASSQGSDVLLQDIVLTCEPDCSITTDYCPYGCSDELDACLEGSPSDAGTSITGALDLAGVGWVIDIWWYIMALVVTVIITVLIAKNSSGAVAWQLPAIIFVGIILFGLAIPDISHVNWIIAVLISAVVAIFVAKFSSFS